MPLLCAVLVEWGMQMQCDALAAHQAARFSLPGPPPAFANVFAQTSDIYRVDEVLA